MRESAHACAREIVRVRERNSKRNSESERERESSSRLNRGKCRVPSWRKHAGILLVQNMLV